MSNENKNEKALAAALEPIVDEVVKQGKRITESNADHQRLKELVARVKK